MIRRLFALLIIAACASPKTRPALSESAAEAPTVGDDFDDLEGTKTPVKKAAPSLRAEEMAALDFSPDGFPRIKKFFRGQKLGGAEILDRVETDFNGDGRVDFIQWYDSTGTWVEKDAADLNGDGMLDVTSYYKKSVTRDQPELVLQKFTTPRSKETNLWKHFKNGELRMRAIDRNGDGRPDYWEYYDKGRLVRTDRDSNGDGLPDGQVQFPQIVTPKGELPPVR